MASVWVDIDLDEVSTRDLINELEDRYLDTREKEYLFDVLKSEEGEKFKLFLSIKDKYSLLELLELFKEDNFVQKIPKEQLSLFEITTTK